MRSTMLTVCALAALGLFADSVNGDYIYTEDFNTSGGPTGLPFGDFGWTVVASDGTRHTDSTSFCHVDLSNVVEGNRRTYWSSGANGKGWFVTDATASQDFESISEVRWLEWWEGVDYRLGLKVGGAWYLSSALTSSDSGGFDPHDGAHPGVTVNDFSSTSSFRKWLTAPPDDETAWDVSLGDATLPPGNITSVGLMALAGSNNHYFDYFQIDGSYVPEPATLALMALGGAGLLLRRRCR